MKGYKVFSPEFKCRDFQFEENKEYKHKGAIEVCASGFHFCIKANDCFNYYSFDSNNIVCEVEALGKTQTHDSDSKVVTDHIKIGRRLTWHEVLQACNDGKDNTGRRNSGNCNSGDSNSGDWNSGNWNSGNWNSGDSNSGYRNSGAFCLDDNPVVWLFDKPTKIKVRDWEEGQAVNIMRRLLDFNLWIPFSSMTKEEKEAHQKAETTDGYLKTITLKEAWANMWGNLSKENKKVFTSLENFDSDKFFQITGIKTKP